MKNKIPRTFPEFLKYVSIRYTDKIALQDYESNTAYTYKELFAKVKQISKKLDIEMGDRVLLYKLHSLDWVVVFLAIQFRGGVAVPVCDRMSNEFIQDVVSLTNPIIAITNEKERSDLSVQTVSYMQLSNFDEKRQYTDIIKSNMPAEIIFTSGTWAKPKGVTLSQRNLLANVEQLSGAYPHDDGDVMLAVLPLSHAYQQVFGLFTPLAFGSKIVFLRGITSFALIGAIKKHKVTVLPVVPRVLKLLQSAITRKIKSKVMRIIFLRVVFFARIFPKSMRRLLFKKVHNEIGASLNIIVSGGAPLSGSLDKFFQGLGYTVFVGYGLSECSPVVSASLNQRRRKGEVGKPLKGVIVKQNINNELSFGGENVFMGYWPNISNRVKMFKSGDIGNIVDGKIILNGRNKNLIIAENGEKIFCEDIEKILNDIDDIEDSFVCEITKNGQQIIACVVKFKDDNMINTRMILEGVNKKLPSGVKIFDIICVKDSQFHYTHTMKIDRKKMMEILEVVLDSH